MIVGMKRVLILRDTYDRWMSANPILIKDEPSTDLTNDQIRIGDGETAWADLPVATGEDALNLLLRSR